MMCRQNEKNMDDRAVKFCVGLNKTKIETIVLLWEAFREDSLHESVLWQ